MTAPRTFLLVVILLGTCGCRNRDPSVDMLESELIWREDQVYALQDQMAWYEAQIESCRRENAALRKELNGTSGGSAATGTGRTPRRDTTPALPDIELPGSSDQPEIDLGTPTLPEIDFGTPVNPDDDLDSPLPNETGGVNRTQAKPTAAGGSTGQGGTAVPDDDSPAADQVSDRHVTKVVLNRRLTGGKDFDGQQGDDGILVVLEPQNAAGEYVAEAAPVSVVVLDPFKTGQAAYVARWNFDAVDTAGLLRKSLLGRGIYLDLPWPNQPPEHSQLKLYVRYLPPDGRKLDVQKDITVDLPAQPPEQSPTGVTAAKSQPREERVARKEKTDREARPESKNPLRPDGKSPDRKKARATGQRPGPTDTTYEVPPNHNPNEPPPLWNPDAAGSGSGDEQSVVTGRSRGSADSRGRVDQALRPRPWSPER